MCASPQRAGGALQLAPSSRLNQHLTRSNSNSNSNSPGHTSYALASVSVLVSALVLAFVIVACGCVDLWPEIANKIRTSGYCTRLRLQLRLATRLRLRLRLRLGCSSDACVDAADDVVVVVVDVAALVVASLLSISQNSTALKLVASHSTWLGSEFAASAESSSPTSGSRDPLCVVLSGLGSSLRLRPRLTQVSLGCAV